MKESLIDKIIKVDLVYKFSCSSILSLIFGIATVIVATFFAVFGVVFITVPNILCIAFGVSVVFLSIKIFIDVIANIIIIFRSKKK